MLISERRRSVRSKEAKGIAFKFDLSIWRLSRGKSIVVADSTRMETATDEEIDSLLGA
jgi:hypothetical protein